ncbi:hypothetical protein KKG65_01080, partial [Patescibacteria group bacterium]|nr:hypothetical protein [Patescibacteria group bacterium]
MQKKLSKHHWSKLLIVTALVLLVAVPLIASNLDKFRGDIRQRAAPPTEKSQCVGCAGQNYEWEWKNGECKKKYKKDCPGGGGGEGNTCGIGLFCVCQGLPQPTGSYECIDDQCLSWCCPLGKVLNSDETACILPGGSS